MFSQTALSRYGGGDSHLPYRIVLVTRKPLLSMVIHVSGKQKLNKICGKDYLQARVHTHANTCKMR